MKERIRVLLCPPPEPGRVETGLRFTDILFGFVIRELFLRLQNWSQLDSYVRWHLVVGATLVLGSWIGFRRSLNRTTYEVKFFNLPLFRFLMDQLMVILYFRIAVLTDIERKSFPTAHELATTTIELLVSVFLLYVVWDVLGIWMAKARAPAKANGVKPRYPVVRDGKMTGEQQPADYAGLAISAVSLALFGITRCFFATPSSQFVAAVIILLAYRAAKEVRTSWRSL